MAEKFVRPRVGKGSLWEGLDGTERSILFCASRILPPVSIDTLCALCDAPATKVLGVMEGLKTRRLVQEKSGYPRGTYFFKGTDLAVDRRALHLHTFAEDDEETHPLLHLSAYGRRA
jgi:hypothetical protein